MFISIEELKSVLYEYQTDMITEYDEGILAEAIESAVTEVCSYLLASNARRETATLSKQQYANWRLYDTDAIFAAEGTERNAFLVRLTKRVAAWNIVELSAPDVLYDRVKERYEASVKLLERIAGMGEYVNERLVIGGVPYLDEQDSTTDEPAQQPFRMVSRPKFHHE